MTILTISLQRESPFQQWGFTLVGGYDCDTHLIVEKVTTGSPAHQSGLRSGDIVHQINYQPANLLSHQRASDTIKNSPYSVNFIS